MAMKITFVREVGACGQYFAHEEGTDAATWQGFDLLKDAKKAAMGIVKAENKTARKAMNAEKKAMNAAERATKSVQKAAEKAAEKLAAEEAVLVEKKARLAAFVEAGTFSLVG